MAHLIQPLDVDDTVYCVDQWGNRATRVVNTEILGIPTDLADITALPGPWTMDLVGIVSDFEVSFGVGCASSVELEFSVSTSASTYYVSIGVYVNGVVHSGQVIDESTSSVDPLVIDLTDRPCGNVITIFTNIAQDDNEDLRVTGTINSVT